MDTSILNTLSLIAPDLMEEMELRALILERVAALEPIGRRALAARLHLAEREVRAAAEALKKAGCLTQSASGMELTPQGQSLVEAARAVSGGRRTLSGIELTLSQMLGVERVCVVRGDADIDSGVMEEVARAAARQIRFLLQGAHVMAVTGGRTVAKTAEAIAVAAPMEITVVPAQGGMGGGVSTQANTVAERFAQKQHVWVKPFLFIKEHRACAPHAGLYLVNNEQHAVLFSPLLKLRQISFGRSYCAEAFAQLYYQCSTRLGRTVAIYIISLLQASVSTFLCTHALRLSCAVWIRQQHNARGKRPIAHFPLWQTGH